QAAEHFVMARTRYHTLSHTSRRGHALKAVPGPPEGGHYRRRAARAVRIGTSVCPASADRIGTPVVSGFSRTGDYQPTDFLGSNSIAIPFMQYRNPVGP